MQAEIEKFYKDQGLVDIRAKSNGQFSADCPSCRNGKKNHFYFNAEGVYNCHCCGIKGNASTYLEKFKNIIDKTKRKNLLQGYGLYSNGNGRKRIVETYSFRSLDGTILHQEVKYDPKGFLQRRPDGNGDFIWNIDGIETVLYHLKEVVESETVIIAEGPKDCDNITKHFGYTATTNPMGAGNWKDDYNKYLKNKTVYIFYDRDDDPTKSSYMKGYKHAIAVANQLLGIAKTIKIVDLQEHFNNCKIKDISDFIDAGGTKDKLLSLIDCAAEYSEKIVVQDATNKNNDDLILEKYFEEKTFIPTFLSEDILRNHRFVYTLKRFYHYTDGYWKPVDVDFLAEIAKSMLGRHSRSNRISEVVNDIKLSVLFYAKLNQQIDFLNLKNGMLDCVNKKLISHSSDFYSSVRINANYNVNAKCPRWTQFLGEVLEPDTIPIFQEMVGYFLIPDVRHEKAFMLPGLGANGKGTSISVVCALLGNENVSEIPLQNLCDRFQTAQLEGKLINIFADLNSRAMQDTGHFKSVVSGDRLTVERKHQDPFSFEPYARLLFSCNEIPRSYDRTYAFYRRWIIIPFNRKFSGDQRDKSLKIKLINELDGIFLWALEGLHRLYTQQDFSESKTANESLEQYKLCNDNVLQFTGECCLFGEGFMVGKTVLYDAYKEFCSENSLRFVSQRKFNQELKDKNPSIYETMDHFTKKRTWKGIKLSEN